MRLRVDALWAAKNFFSSLSNLRLKLSEKCWKEREKERQKGYNSAAPHSLPYFIHVCSKLPTFSEQFSLFHPWTSLWVYYARERDSVITHKHTHTHKDKSGEERERASLQAPYRTRNFESYNRRPSSIGSVLFGDSRSKVRTLFFFSNKRNKRQHFYYCTIKVIIIITKSIRKFCTLIYICI